MAPLPQAAHEGLRRGMLAVAGGGIEHAQILRQGFFQRGIEDRRGLAQSSRSLHQQGLARCQCALDQVDQAILPGPEGLKGKGERTADVAPFRSPGQGLEMPCVEGLELDLHPNRKGFRSERNRHHRFGFIQK